MRADLAEQENLLHSRESAQWVLSRDKFISGFQFSTGDGIGSGVEVLSAVSTGQRVLSGNGYLKMSLADCRERQVGNFRIFENSNISIGHAQVPVFPETLEKASYDMYRSLLDAVGDRSLCRIWNYVPGINETHPGLIENYKLFCSGRSKAFEDVFGEETPSHYPAASATGTDSDQLTVLFIATCSKVENWENPEQIPAYNYPAEYGPRPPSFARASHFTDENGIEWIFISGTASIKGYTTHHRGDFKRQLDVTLNNIDLVLQKCGLRLTDCESGRRRHFKAFLRNRRDLDALLDKMHNVMGQGDSLSVVEGNVCRQDLEVEIELTVFPSERPRS